MLGVLKNGFFSLPIRLSTAVTKATVTVTMVRLRTVLILMIGVFVGLVFSPISVLFQFSELELSARQITAPCVLKSDITTTPRPRRNVSNLPLFSPVDTSPPPPPKFPHDPCKLSHHDNVSSPSNPLIRYKYLSSELAQRKLLYIGVISSAKYLPTRAVGIYNTWAKDILPDMHFYSAPPEDPLLGYLPIVTLPGINDTQYPPQKKVYRTLKYMADNFIDKYDFFIRSDDDVYYRMDRLMKLIEGINPAQDIYMGSPGFGKEDDRDRLKLEEHEHYCMGGPGVFFSRSALRKLAPHLETCLENVVVSWNEDVEIGRCVSKMLSLQCTWSWETKVIFWTDYKKALADENLYTSDVVKATISLHPIKDPRLMYRVHQYMQELRLRSLIQMVSHIQADIQSISSLVPPSMSRYRDNRWLWYNLGSNPVSRFEILTWEYFNSTRLFLNYEHMPVVSLPPSLMAGSNTALEVLLDVMNSLNSNKDTFVPPYQLIDGFTITDHSSGVQYHLHVSVRRQNAAVLPVEFFANVFLPFQGAGMATYREARPVLSQVIHLLLCVARTHDITDFIKYYEQVCLHSTTAQTYLHVAIFGTNPKATGALSQLMQTFPSAAIFLYSMGDIPFSYSHGYDHIADKLSNDSLLLLFDINFHFTEHFLVHCRMLVKQGAQAYFPVAFSFYKPELLERYSQRPIKTLISSDTGFFLRYNYQIAAIYRSDYYTIGGFVGTAKPGTTATTSNDEIRFIDKVLETSVFALRGLEPYLRKNYKARSCRGLEGNSYTVCINSRADSIASKKILGALIAANNLMD